MRPPTIEIYGTGTHNRGAELMAIAIAQRLRSSYPGVRISVPPRFGDFEARGEHGFYTSELPGIRAALIERMASPAFRRHAGIIPAREIDAVLDASGFAFSDQWGPVRANNLVSRMNRPARVRQPLLLLPQALGPFEDPEVREETRRLFERARLVCARDEQSLKAAEQLGGARALRKYPDFTIGLSPTPPTSLPAYGRFVALVPNIHMIGKTETGDSYISFLRRVIALVKGKGLQPVFVMHDAKEDRQVIARVDAGEIPVLEHRDPLVLKGILGRAEFVVASRFHALVSALSQSVPCVGAGWSHKYPELFKDFDSEELLVSDLTDENKLSTIMDELTDPVRHGLRVQRIGAAVRHLKAQTEQMWHEVETLLEAEVPSLKALRTTPA